MCKQPTCFHCSLIRHHLHQLVIKSLFPPISWLRGPALPLGCQFRLVLPRGILPGGLHRAEANSNVRRAFGRACHDLRLHCLRLDDLLPDQSRNAVMGRRYVLHHSHRARLSDTFTNSKDQGSGRILPAKDVFIWSRIHGIKWI